MSLAEEQIREDNEVSLYTGHQAGDAKAAALNEEPPAIKRQRSSASCFSNSGGDDDLEDVCSSAGSQPRRRKIRLLSENDLSFSGFSSSGADAAGGSEEDNADCTSVYDGSEGDSEGGSGDLEEPAQLPVLAGDQGHQDEEAPGGDGDLGLWPLLDSDKENLTPEGTPFNDAVLARGRNRRQVQEVEITTAGTPTLSGGGGARVFGRLLANGGDDDELDEEQSLPSLQLPEDDEDGSGGSGDKEELEALVSAAVAAAAVPEGPPSSPDWPSIQLGIDGDDPDDLLAGLDPGLALNENVDAAVEAVRGREFAAAAGDDDVTDDVTVDGGNRVGSNNDDLDSSSPPSSSSQEYYGRNNRSDDVIYYESSSEIDRPQLAADLMTSSANRLLPLPPMTSSAIRLSLSPVTTEQPMTSSANRPPPPTSTARRSLVFYDSNDQFVPYMFDPEE